jgi:hypothetical protein
MFVPALAAATLVGGCANQYGYDNGGIFGDIFGGGVGSGSQFERDAVNACGREAERYGRVQITDVRQDGRDAVLVYGRIDTRDSRGDEFFCAFGSNGRILEFRRS